MNAVAIVTGASSGIGKATAIRLARDFSGITLAARGGENLADVGAQVKAIGAEPLIVEADLSTAAAAELVVKKTLETFGRIDALLNIAGAVPGLDVFEMTDEQWDAGMALKFHAGRRLAIHAWDALKSSRGSIVFISGNAADIPAAAQAAVGSINAGIEALAKAFAERGMTDGVQVNSVSPGAIMTSRRSGMLEKFATANKLSLEDAEKRFLARAGISRFGKPEEIADLMAFAVSPQARWMTGTTLRMDGGEVRSL
jgi:3-oxoacyl-[acyl-carrier protein] reductase